MKKILVNSVFLIFFLLLILIVILSTIGIATDKFNDLISNKISKKNIDLKLDKIHFKIDPKKFNLFLETKNPKIKYRGVLIPIKNAKVYIDFLSLLKSETKIKKTSLTFEELDVKRLSKYSLVLKPSNLKNFFNKQ